MRGKRTDQPDRLVISDPGAPALVVVPSTTTAILGRSGSGKTRWIRRLVGLDEPVLDLRLGGRRLDVRSRRETMAFVPQGDGVFLSETVFENVAQRPHGPVVDDAVARDCLELVGLTDRARDPSSNLNTDERRRVALARALALQRPFLVVDGFLTPATMRHLPLSLVQLPWVQSIIVTSTSASDDVRRAATVAVMGEGRIIAAGVWSELIARSDARLVAELSWVIPEE